jgi:tripartite-type tricarboxylate transporter receptor subunit TctC
MKILLFALILFGSAFCAAAYAQDPAGRPYPAKPIRLIVGFPAGGPNDTQARLVGQKIGESMGQPVVVDNRPGADGIIGADLVAKSPADGYTLILVSAGHAINPNFHKLPYHPLDDFMPIAQIARSPFVLVVHPSLPVRSVRDMIKFAKARPGELNYGSAGKGSSLQLAMELFMSMAGVAMVHVPYKGGAPATTDLIAGRVQVMMNNIVSTLPPVRSGKLRALAVTTAQRFVATPELPTVGEVLPGYEANAWYGILAPRRMPADIASKLNSEINKAIALPEIRQRLLSLGLEPAGGTSAEFRNHINAELARWAKLVRDNNIRID